MLVLPDYIVLDFLEWISQNYPRNNGFLGPLLYDEKIAMSYAEKYFCLLYTSKHHFMIRMMR